MIYKRKNGKKSFFQNSYQELAGYLIIGFISFNFGIKGLENINNDNKNMFSYILVIQLIIYALFYILKFKKYFSLKD